MNVNIVLPIPSDKLFVYCIDDDLVEDHLIGRRVLVPVGKRIITGIIVDLNVKTDLSNIRHILEILDSKPVFSESMLKFTKWIAEYYFCSWGEVLKAALPAGMSPKNILRVIVTNPPSEESLRLIAKRHPNRSLLLKFLMLHNQNVSVNFIEEKLKTGSVSFQLEALEEAGIIKCERILEKDIKAKTQKGLMINIDLINDEEKLQEIFKELDKNAPKQSLLLSAIYLHQIKHSSPITITQAIQKAGTTAQSVKALVEKKLITILDVEINRSIISENKRNLIQKDETNITLTVEQEKALSSIVDSMKADLNKTFLLHGVTGSGKTLVYIHAIKYAFIKGKTALLLVPEISLTPQLIDRFNAVFPNDISVLHSRMSDGERFDAWRSINNQKTKIVIGARSAVFAPLHNLGLIIVDEEHESSYKQDSPSPRYNARDAAIMRGKLENAIVLLGSATPSLESMYNCNTTKYKLLELKERADNATLPEINIVNTIEARKKGEMSGSFSLEMMQEISERIEKKEGVILLQNRRGFSSFLECSDCGHVPKCKYCDVSLTYHKAKSQLRCHYCGYTIKAVNTCQSCGLNDLKEVGYGTQRIEEDLIEYFKSKDLSVKIARMDLDTTSKRGSHRKILHSFGTGETDILLGTQMVAKGLDFERVTLVGVINADIQLYLPDFRASEKTFQLLTQVAGRAGRTSGKPGEVFIQTSHPENHSIQSVNQSSYQGFYNLEIEHRKKAQYPPFTRFNIIKFSGKDFKKVNDHSKIFADLLPRENKYFTLLGPVEPVISKIKMNYFRFIVLKNNKITDPSGSKFRLILLQAYKKYNEKYYSKSVKVVIDIDSFAGF